MEGFNLSQEFQISQETLNNSLWEILNADGNLLNEVLQAAPVQMQSVRSSLPAISDWPGDYGFNVTFGQMDVNAKNWVYHEDERRLYVKKDAPCPVNFSVSAPTRGALIRVMAVYVSPEHASEVVHRCIRHSMGELNAEIFEAEHLIRSECRGAEYVVHEGTNRHSVVLPFENPPAGQCFSTYIYKFACWGSCPGGPNRRPIAMVFNLEQNNLVIGRRSIHLKICANPGRDSGAAKIAEAPIPKKIRTCLQQVPVPKRKFEEGKYVIKTTDIECFKFLQNMKKMYKMNMKVSCLPRDYRYFLTRNVSSSEDDFSSLQ